MPGKHLSTEEKRLKRFWENPPNSLARPFLSSIEVSGGNGIRGIDGLLVPFRYPLTAICGKNGSGKTTILALAALAFSSPSGWYVHWVNSRPRPPKRGVDRTHFIFPDFFVFGRGDSRPLGVQIRWRYFDGRREISLEFNKTGQQWGKYASRPEREVDYLPLGRVVPALETSSVRSAFANPARSVTNEPLDREYCRYLNYIMGRNYESAQIQLTDRLSFQSCQSTQPYTGFNMGGGESCVIQLLHLLQRIPPMGLMVIEEIESSLHPEAQERLAQILIKICYKKKIQIVCSTHSEIILDALPREARLLLRRSGDSHEVVSQPSTRFAIYEMSGQVQPELVIFCEDSTAAILINETLPHTIRHRVRIQEVGSDATVVRQIVSHIRGGNAENALCVLDGDCTTGQVETWISQERGDRTDITPNYLILPGDGAPPEGWVLDQLGVTDYRDEFARQIDCQRTDIRNHVSAMKSGLDHHDIGYTLSQRTGLEKNDCLHRIMRSVARTHPQLEELREKVGQLLG